VFKKSIKNLDYLLQIYKRANAGVLWYTCVFEWAPRQMSSEKWRGTSSYGRQIAGVGPIAAQTCISSKLVSTDWEQRGRSWLCLHFIFIPAEWEILIKDLYLHVYMAFQTQTRENKIAK
jgi:hypothetical protein